MRKRLFYIGTMVLLLAAGRVGRAQMTPWLQWTLLPKTVMSEIVGESSGENAYHMIMETGGYDLDRTPDEFASMFHETKYYLEKAKAYGFAGAEVARFPSSGTTWDAVKGELWEVSPIRQKIASYIDSAAMLAQGSTTGEVTGELVWVGAGRPADLEGKDLAGKIAVTEGNLSAPLQRGAAAVLGVMNSPRPLFDPLQMAWANVPNVQGRPAIGFQVPPREGEYLKKRLLAGQKITVKAQVASETRKFDLQNVTWAIPGTDPNAGEIIFSAHLFEGYVKQGGNDDISGCAVVMEIARTLNTLIKEGRIPQPRRTIRFVIGPEFSGTGPWVKANKALMEKTLCNINLDMVGLWLSKSQSFMCLMRTTFGNAHYINDVMENYYRYVGEGNRERIQLRSNFYPVPQRIVAPTGADEPFYYGIETHYGASDHEVFNDWSVQVPGVMMIDWPDRWYHTSGDHVDKTDPTQLKRVTIIGAAAAYTIAAAEDDAAIRIAGETASNGNARLAHQLARGLVGVAEAANAEELATAHRRARAYVEAAAINEKDTLETVNQLATDKKRVAEHVALLQKGIDQVAASELAVIDGQMKAAATRLKTSPVAARTPDLEAAAAKLTPKPTAKVKANGYLGWRETLNQVPQEQRAKLPAGRVDVLEVGRLVNGRHSVLDIKKMLDTQSETESDLQQVMNVVDQLALAGLVEKPAPPAPAKKR